jgi:hypothetical protein
VLVLLVVFPMRSECREPHHSGRTATIRAAVVLAQSGMGETVRMGKTSEHPQLSGRPGSELAAQNMWPVNGA